MLISYQLFPHCRRCCLIVVFLVSVLSLLLASWIWRLVVKVVGVGVLLSLLFRRCWQRCPLIWLHPSDSAPRFCRSLVVVIFGGVTSMKNNASFCS